MKSFPLVQETLAQISGFDDSSRTLMCGKSQVLPLALI